MSRSSGVATATAAGGPETAKIRFPDRTTEGLPLTGAQTKAVPREAAAPAARCEAAGDTVEQWLDEADLMPLITETQDDPARLSRVLNHVLERRVDAVVVGAARLGNAPILMEVASRRV